EDLSCNPEYKNWFSNIKALWLDGCNTVTDNLIASGSSNIPTPDGETARVVAKEYEPNEMDLWSVWTTSQAYTASLDENTPLSSRHLRMFPNTQIYGFNGAAPTSNQKWGESFIVNHLSLIGKALKSEDDQIKTNEQEDDIKRALSAILSFDDCDEEKLKAWEEAGRENMESIEQQSYERAYKLGCNLILAKQLLNDPDSEKNQKALAEYIKNLKKEDVNDELLALANDILKNSNSEKAIELAKGLLLETLDEVTSQDTNITEQDKSYTHLLFNNIYDTWKTAEKYKAKDYIFYKNVQEKLKADNFTVSLKERIESNQTASLRKGDYIKFYMEVNDHNLSNLPNCNSGTPAPPCIKEEIKKLIQNIENVFENLRSPRLGSSNLIDLNSRRALAVSVVDQLLQYDLLQKDQIDKIIDNKKLFPDDNNNPFITEVKFSLILSDEQSEKTYRKKFIDGKIEQSDRLHVLNYLSRKYFQNPPINLDILQEVTDNLDTRRNNRIEVRTFFNVMHNNLSNYSQKEKEDFIVTYSQESDENLEKLLLWYADTYFSEDSKKSICQRLKSNQIKPLNLGYVCKN
ncbi:MAG: hypothetical protein OXC37_04585, partial [Bdellovibrionaceae bacterium]|nr:hypothetical protein [Pseudobdellovibrionaceae bacterium]